MRDGHCTETQDDRGSHHICIDLSSTSGGNFCSVTGQPDWCSSTMGCNTNYLTSTCPVEHWCVCQWAFASYILNAGGCDKIQDIVCEATNSAALAAYEAQAPNYPHISDALDCIRSRCGLEAEGREVETPTSEEITGPIEDNRNGDFFWSGSIPALVGGVAVCVVAGLVLGLFLGRWSHHRQQRRDKDSVLSQSSNNNKQMI